MARIHKLTVPATLLAALLAVIMLLPQGCGKKAGGDTIKIGVILPLTGGLGNFGETVLNGVKLAVEQHTSESTDLSIGLKSEDSQGDATRAVSAFNKLVDIDGVRIVIGDLTSSATLAMAPIAQTKKILLISPTASNPALTIAGQYFYRVWPSDSFDGQIAASFCYRILGLKKAAILYVNNDYGVGLKDVFEEHFIASGGVVSGTESFQEQQTDYRTSLSKISELNVDVVYIPGHPQEIGTCLRQARELGIATTFFSNVAAEDQEFLTVAGDAASGLYFTAPTFDIQSKDERISSFVADYRSRFGSPPDVHAAKGYDAAFVILKGLAAGYITPEHLQNFLDTTTAFIGVSGEFSFDSNGDVVTEVAVKRYENDGTIAIIDVVTPK